MPDEDPKTDELKELDLTPDEETFKAEVLMGKPMETPKKEAKPAEPVKEPILETRRCEDCQGDGRWDGVLCATCHGSGKIFKDGVVVLTAAGKTFVADKGVLTV